MFFQSQLKREGLQKFMELSIPGLTEPLELRKITENYPFSDPLNGKFHLLSSNVNPALMSMLQSQPVTVHLLYWLQGKVNSLTYQL